MTYTNDLYAELKEDVGLLSDPLFDMSEHLLRKRGNFLPHGAALTAEGEVRLVAAAPDTPNDMTNSVEVLPVLHDGLRQLAKEITLVAVATAENVTVTLDGQDPTDAIKVLFEHKQGLTVALYLPFKKKLFRRISVGSAFCIGASPEIKAWPSASA